MFNTALQFLGKLCDASTNVAQSCKNANLQLY